MKEAPVAIVTGAAGGIGRATALHLAENGYRVFGVVRRPLADALPGVSLLLADVRRQSEIGDAVEEVIAAAGRLDLLVNNAGTLVMGPFEEGDPDAERAMMDANVFGAIHFSRAVLPEMRRRRSGRLIHVGSILGLIPAPFMALYSASKHALEGFSESLDHEIREFGIRSILVEPGFTKTSFLEHAASPPGGISDYDKTRASAERAAQAGVAAGDAPMLVARAILKAAQDPRPKARYAVGKARMLSALRRWAPPGVFAKGLRKQFGLER